MKRNRAFFALLAAALAAAALPLAAQAKTAEPAWQISGAKNGFGFKMATVGDRAVVEMSYATTGWIAVGFDPSRMMKDADMIIAYVRDGKAYARDDFGNSPVSHVSDVSLGGTDDVKLLASSQKDGVTTIRFSIPLAATHYTDVTLSPGQHRVIMAAGRGADFTSMHMATTSFPITIGGGAAGGTPPAGN